MGVFEEPEPGRFALNEPARGLLDSAGRLGFDLEGIGGRMAHAWGSLLTAVRTGAPAYHTIFGRPFWEDLQAHPEVAASFDALMGPAGHGTPDPEVLVSGGWDPVRTVADVGGGTGALLAEILRARPGVRGILVDLPADRGSIRRDLRGRRRVRSRHHGRAELLRPAAGRGRPLPAQEPAGRLARSRGDALLRRCAQAARPAGRVVVLGGVSPDEGHAPSPELLMLVLVGGKARSLSEFRDLAARGRPGRAGHRPPAVGPLHRRVPPRGLRLPVTLPHLKRGRPPPTGAGRCLRARTARP